jgi:hypothetical protein
MRPGWVASKRAKESEAPALNIDVAPVAAAPTMPLVPAEAAAMAPAFGASAAGAATDVCVPVVEASVWVSAMCIVVDFGDRLTTLRTVT